MLVDRKNIILAVFFGGMAFIGAYGAFFSVHDYRASVLSAQWPQTSATVQEHAREGVLSHLNADYVYHFSGINYRTQKVRFFTNNRLFHPAPSMQFVPGDSFTIFINPRNHAEAVLIPDTNFLGFLISLLIGAGIFFTGFGCFLRCIKFIPQGNSIDAKPIEPFQQ